MHYKTHRYSLCFIIFNWRVYNKTRSFISDEAIIIIGSMIKTTKYFILD